MPTVHARMRALQRFGILFSEEQLTELENMISSGQGQNIPGLRFIEKRNKTTSIWEVDLLGKTLLAVYSRRTHRIVTFMRKCSNG